ncbi:hypothetical protein FY557_16805 [Chryseobacterium sp. SN22]|uniref:hypothetical protein n=1 Tax=Chryseobacterium sp. SN22 TaxID=2606431 RepID=UPI0011EC2ECB|nr:hypothetical protein [Chryseobacterium sp. SN22]KAA0126562.1 hypothetical protein FY557_16805 [Chryseobacterium sp. SN22]
MKNRFILAISLSLVFFAGSANAQQGRVGINTTSPRTTLDVAAKLGTTDADGLQAPRLTRAELTAKGNSVYGTDHAGTIIYISDIAGGDVTSQRVNINATGYYFFDGTFWQKVGAGSDLYKDNGTLTSNRTVSQGTNTMAFTSSATTGTSHFTVDNSTLNVDAANHRVGIGTNSPATKLDVNNGTTPGAVKITDGTQGEGKVLTSDANGVGTWRTMAFSSNVEGTWLINNSQAATNNSIPVNRYSSVAKLSLPMAGTYLVFLNADFGFDNAVSIPAQVEYLITRGGINNEINLANAIGAVPGTWNSIYNSVTSGMGGFTINNTFFIVTTGPQDIYLTIKPIPGQPANNGVIATRLMRWGGTAENPSYQGIPGGLAIDRFVAYKF